MLRLCSLFGCKRETLLGLSFYISNYLKWVTHNFRQELHTWCIFFWEDILQCVHQSQHNASEAYASQKLAPFEILGRSSSSVGKGMTTLTLISWSIRAWQNKSKACNQWSCKRHGDAFLPSAASESSELVCAFDINGILLDVMKARLNTGWFTSK